MKACADKLYEELERRGVEVIYDDRRVSAGVMFADADLLGVPVRLIVSPRNLKKNAVEMVTRDKSYSAEIPVETAADETEKLLRSLAQG